MSSAMRVDLRAQQQRLLARPCPDREALLELAAAYLARGHHAEALAMVRVARQGGLRSAEPAAAAPPRSTLAVSYAGLTAPEAVTGTVLKAATVAVAPLSPPLPAPPVVPSATVTPEACAAATPDAGAFATPCRQAAGPPRASLLSRLVAGGGRRLARPSLLASLAGLTIAALLAATGGAIRSQRRQLAAVAVLVDEDGSAALQAAAGLAAAPAGGLAGAATWPHRGQLAAARAYVWAALAHDHRLAGAGARADAALARGAAAGPWRAAAVALRAHEQPRRWPEVHADLRRPGAHQRHPLWLAEVVRVLERHAPGEPGLARLRALASRHAGNSRRARRLLAWQALARGDWAAAQLVPPQGTAADDGGRLAPWLAGLAAGRIDAAAAADMAARAAVWATGSAAAGDPRGRAAALLVQALAWAQVDPRGLAADRAYGQAVASQPGEPLWPYLRGMAALTAGDAAQAAAALERARQLAPTAYAPRLALARAQLAAGAADSALINASQLARQYAGAAAPAALERLARARCRPLALAGRRRP